ncbi:MAG TPA: hypothetical protein VN670_08305 [Acidobacteriaceae bacterium]|nr:hypothetical protein [Acidobacteriaceae bacterium]
MAINHNTPTCIQCGISKTSLTAPEREFLAASLNAFRSNGAGMAFADMKASASVSAEHAVNAVLQYFFNNAADDFEENPFSLEYRAPTEAEEDALIAENWETALGNPKFLTPLDITLRLRRRGYRR